MSAKQDRTGARTAADLERKYNFGQSFAEVMEIATDARDAADEANEATKKLDGDLNSEEIFKRLTNNGTLQGLYRGEDGELYMNASYIKTGELSADLIKTVKFVATAEVFIEPGAEEIETIKQHLLGNVLIPDELLPLYDSNGDGEMTPADLANFNLCYLGLYSLANWELAKKSTVTLTIDLTNPEKALQITGKNMWGRDIDAYFGVNFTSVKNPNTEQRLEGIAQEIAAIKKQIGMT